MYFYVRVNTKTNNNQCEWICFTLVGHNMLPHDINHWHNSQLPFLCIKLMLQIALTNHVSVFIVSIYCISVRDKETRICWKGKASPLPLCINGQTHTRFDHKSILLYCTLPSFFSFYVATLVTAFSKGEKSSQSFSILSCGNSGGSQGWGKTVQLCCNLCVCYWTERDYCPYWPLTFHFPFMCPWLFEH